MAAQGRRGSGRRAAKQLAGIVQRGQLSDLRARESSILREMRTQLDQASIPCGRDALRDVFAPVRVQRENDITGARLRARSQIEALKQQASATCGANRAQVTDRFAPLLSTLEARRAELLGIQVPRAVSKGRASAAERRSEAEADVLYELEQRHPQLVPLWRRTGRRFMPTASAQERAEQFVHRYEHESTAEAAAAQSADARRFVQQLVREQATRAQEAARGEAWEAPKSSMAVPPSFSFGALAPPSSARPASSARPSLTQGPIPGIPRSQAAGPVHSRGEWQAILAAPQWTSTDPAQGALLSVGAGGSPPPSAPGASALATGYPQGQRGQVPMFGAMQYEIGDVARMKRSSVSAPATPSAEQIIEAVRAASPKSARSPKSSRKGKSGRS